MKESTRTKSVFLILAIFFVGIMLSGPTSLGGELEQGDTQTPSGQIGKGAVWVIEGELASINVQSESELLSETKTLIEKGVPPGTLVSVVKSIKSGHLNAGDLKDAYEMIKTKVLEEGEPPGTVIKSIKSGPVKFESEKASKESNSSEDSDKPGEESNSNSSINSNKVEKLERNSSGKESSKKDKEEPPGKTKERGKPGGSEEGKQPEKEVKSKEVDGGEGKGNKNQNGSEKSKGKGSNKDKDELKDKIREFADKGPPNHAKGKGEDKGKDKSKGKKGENNGKS